MFTSKQQYKTLTSLISRVFDTKLEKTRHKIAVEAGFKTANAFEATIPEHAPVLKLNHEKPAVDGLDMNFLLERTSFTYVPTVCDGKNAIYNILSSNLVSLLFQGHSAKSEELLTQRVLLGETAYGERYGDTTAYGRYILDVDPDELLDDEDDLEPYDTKSYIATLKQRIDPQDIVTDLGILERNPKLTRELIQEGSIYQYNFFCQNPHFIESLGLQNDLLTRYVEQIQLLCEGEEADIGLNSGLLEALPELSEVMTWYESGKRKQALITLKTPPVEFVASLSVLTGNLPDNAFIEELLSKHLVLNFSSDDNCDWLEPCKVYRQDSKDGYVRSDLENAVIRHGIFATEVVALSIVEELRFASGDFDHFEFLETLRNLDAPLSSKYIKRALQSYPTDREGVEGALFSVNVHKVKEPCKESSFFGQSLVANMALGLAYSAVQPELTFVYKEVVQGVFSALPKELLEEPARFKGKISDEWDIADQSSVQDILKLALKVSK